MSSPPPVSQLVVIAHPDPNSFCASIARRWRDRVRQNRQLCDLRDLYAEGFDPVLKANERPDRPGFSPLAENTAERRRLESLDVLVFVYPVWFGSPPAMLKGYIERVVGSGVTFVEGSPDDGVLANVRLVQISTSARSEPWLAEKGIPGAMHTIFDRYIAEVFDAEQAYRLHLDGVMAGMDERHGAMHLAQVEELADRVCAEANADRWGRARAAPPEGAERGGPE